MHLRAQCHCLSKFLLCPDPSSLSRLIMDLNCLGLFPQSHDFLRIHGHVCLFLRESSLSRLCFPCCTVHILLCIDDGLFILFGFEIVLIKCLVHAPSTMGGLRGLSRVVALPHSSGWLHLVSAVQLGFEGLRLQNLIAFSLGGPAER